MRRVVAVLVFTALFASFCAAQQCTMRDLGKGASVRSIVVEGGQPLTADAQAFLKSFLRNPNHDPDCETSASELAERLRRFYQNHGYFKAAVDDPKVLPVGKTGVDLLFVVDPQSMYRLKDIVFRNVTAFPTEELRALFAMRSGDVFAMDPVAEGLDRMRRIYGTKGYINFTSIPEPALDQQSGNIILVIDVDEGPAFTIGTLVLDGEEPAAGAGKKLIEAWQPLVGQTYNGDVLKSFVRNNASLLGVQNPDFEEVLDTKLDQGTHIATMVLHFPYRFGPLILDGVEPTAGVGKKLLEAWQSNIGKVYDPAVLKRFWRENGGLLGPRKLRPEKVLDVRFDEASRIASVLFRFPD